MKIVLASNNPGKIREFSDMFAPCSIELVTQASLGINEIEETGLSFIENALLKARHAAKISGLPALADDSGLAIAALDGAPGIYSARYAGVQCDNNKNITKVLDEMQHVSDAHRHAEFHCVLAFMTHDLDPIPLVCEGKWAGSILREPKGQHGFGYDPIFYVSEEKKSSAELPNELKNRISHRARALQSLMKLLPDKLHECIKR
jgi:XTP/dITP diphosphohydrolase